MSRVQSSWFERPATGRSTSYFSLQYGRKLNEMKSARCYCVKMTDMPVYSDRVRLTGATERYVKAGRTLEDLNPHFKADLHPLSDRGVARFASCCKRFFVQKSSYCVVSLRLFISSRSRRSVFHCESERAPGEPADNVESSICFSSLVTFDLASLHEITCHCEIVPTIFKCVVSRSDQII